MATPARFERATFGLEDRCSIQLSYGAIIVCFISKFLKIFGDLFGQWFARFYKMFAQS